MDSSAVTGVVVPQDFPTAAEMQAEFRRHPERFTAPGPSYLDWDRLRQIERKVVLRDTLAHVRFRQPQYRRASRPVRRVARRVVRGRGTRRAPRSGPEPPPLTAARRGGRR
jgi:hypothetical protein